MEIVLYSVPALFVRIDTVDSNAAHYQAPSAIEMLKLSLGTNSLWWTLVSVVKFV